MVGEHENQWYSDWENSGGAELYYGIFPFAISVFFLLFLAKF